MQYSNAKDQISYGEDDSTEFKPNINNHLVKIAETLTGFANDLNWVGGGSVFIGVGNDKSILGSSENFDDIQKKISDVCRTNIDPPLSPKITQHDFGGKLVYRIKIERSINRPHRYKDVCYIRVASTTRKATAEEENQIRQCSISPSYDHQPLAKSSPDDIDWVNFQNYIKTSKPAEILETDPDFVNIAINLEFLIKSGERKLAKVGTILLFGISPVRYFPQSKIQIIRFKGLDLTAPIASRQIFEGTLQDLIMSARTFIENLSGTASSFLSNSENRIDYIEYPHWAVREAIANAVVHRDYSENGREIDIRIFDDRIEIVSPGGLGGGLLIADLGTGKRFIRNHLIADVLNEIRFIERAGTGILRMRKEMEANGSPQPVFIADVNSFTAILPAHPYYSSQRILEEANHEKTRSNYPTARRLYEKALEVNPGNYHALIDFADLEMQIGNRDGSRELYRKAILLNPKIPHAWLSLAILEERAGNIAAAREVYRDASKKTPNNGVIYRNWAVLEWTQKKYKDADNLFEEAIRRDPSDCITWYKRGQMNINSPIEIIKKQGESELHKAINLTDDSYILADIYFLLARAMPKLRYNSGEIQDAYKKSLELNPNRGSTYYHFGEYLNEIGKNQDAKSNFQKSKELGFVPKQVRKVRS